MQYQLACTRKLNDNLVLMAKAKGITIDCEDLLKIDFLESTELTNKITSNIYPIVFTSKNAVNAFRNITTKNSIIVQTNQAFCIAGITENTAIKEGFNILAVAPDSVSLAERISKDFLNKNLLHAGSNLQLNNWKNILLEKGIRVDSIEIYHKEKVARKLNAEDGVIFFSPSQIDAFYGANTISPEKPAFCIGKTTASQLKQHQHKNILIAAQANEIELLNEVYNYFNIK